MEGEVEKCYLVFRVVISGIYWDNGGENRNCFFFRGESGSGGFRVWGWDALSYPKLHLPKSWFLGSIYPVITSDSNVLFR